MGIGGMKVVHAVVRPSFPVQRRSESETKQEHSRQVYSCVEPYELTPVSTGYDAALEAVKRHKRGLLTPRPLVMGALQGFASSLPAR
jgi:hypothetical protein